MVNDNRYFSFFLSFIWICVSCTANKVTLSDHKLKESNINYCQTKALAFGICEDFQQWSVINWDF